MSTVLHELLAVEQGLAETANRITKEVTGTLSKKQTIFQGMTKAHEIFAEADQYLVAATEHKEVQSTVDEQIDFLNLALASYWDVSLQKEEANQRAKADIIIDNNIIAAAVPSIVLLGLEKKLSGLLAVYNAIPTLDAATAWERDEGNAKANVFRTKYSTERQQSITTKQYVEIAKATDRHQAQMVAEDSIDVIGKYTINEFSGAISSHDKAKRLDNLTILIRAVKSARQRANNVEVHTELQIGKALLNFING